MAGTDFARVSGEAGEGTREVDHTASIASHWRAIKAGAWLGWQIQSNWTDPWLFATYSVIKPIAGTLIIYFIYVVALFATEAPPALSLAFIYVGSAFYMFVFQAFWGLFEVIQGDREWFQTIKYIYIAPVSFSSYVAGRGATQMSVAGFGVAIVLAFGVYVLQIPIGMVLTDVPFFLAILVLGALLTVALGLAIGSITFVTARHGSGISEGVAGVFYIFSGVIFPLTVLPVWGQAFGRSLPLTYWFEGLRRAMIPGYVGDLSDPLFGMPDGTLVLLLLAATIGFGLLSILVFRSLEYVARLKGKIDQTTAY